MSANVIHIGNLKIESQGHGSSFVVKERGVTARQSPTQQVSSPASHLPEHHLTPYRPARRHASRQRVVMWFQRYSAKQSRLAEYRMEPDSLTLPHGRTCWDRQAYLWHFSELCCAHKA